MSLIFPKELSEEEAVQPLFELTKREQKEADKGAKNMW